MQRAACFLSVCCAIFILNSAASGGEEWSKPFDHAVFNSIDKTVGNGNFIWFMTENGVGQYNVKTKASKFFNYSTIGRSWYPRGNYVTLLNGDSSHVTFIITQYLQTGEHRMGVVMYNGTTWTESFCPVVSAQYFIPNADNRGNLWLSTDSLIIKYDGRDWKVLLEKANNKVFPDRCYFADDSGSLWGSYTDDSTRLCRFDGKQVTPIAALFSGAAPRGTRALCDAYGTVWVCPNDNSLYRITNDRTLTKFLTKGMVGNMDFVVDADGCIWSLVYQQNSSYQLIRMKPGTDFVATIDSLPINSSITSASDGIYSNRLGEPHLDRYTDEPVAKTTLSISSMGTAFGDLDKAYWNYKTYFKKDGSIISAEGFNTYFVSAFNGGKCTSLPLINISSCSFSEKKDGTLLLYNAGNGIQVLNESRWVTIPGTDSMWFHSAMTDKNDHIWGIGYSEATGTRIVRQTETGFDLINPATTSLRYADYDTYIEDIPPFIEDKKGVLWASLYRAVTSTTDGINWNTYDSASGLPVGILQQMYLDSAGIINLLIFTRCKDALCSELVHGTFDEAWNFETISPPINLENNVNHVFGCRNGDIWIDDNKSDDYQQESQCRMLRYTNGSWIVYDTVSTPYLLMRIIGEDGTGKMYFQDQYHETVVFGQNGSNAVTAIKPLHMKQNFSAFSACRGKITVNYHLQNASARSITLYTLSGRQVQQLAAGFCPAGSFTQQFNVGITPGAYLLRLTTAGAVQNIRVMVR